jgi:hypothetical protein
MTQPQNDGTWQSSYGQPQDHAAQTAYQAQPAQPAGYGHQYPGQPAAAQPYGQPAPPESQFNGQAAQSYGQPTPQAAQSYGQPGPYRQPAVENTYPQAYPETPYQQAPPAPPYGGYNVPGSYGPAGGMVAPAPVGEAPGIGTVIVITALFGLFGAIPAAKRAGKAQALGLPSGKYWMAFGATLVLSWVAGIFLLIMMISAAAAAVDETSGAAQSTPITADWLEQSIIEKGDFQSTDGSAIKPTDATCAPKSVNDAGAGTWNCTIEFGAKNRQGFEVTVAADGRWVTSRGE